MNQAICRLFITIRRDGGARGLFVRYGVRACSPHLGGGLTELEVTGAVAMDLRLDAASLPARPQVTVTAGGRTYTGAALWPLLQAASIRGTAAKNPTVSMYILATGSDGYQVVISLAEIHPDFGAKPAIVAVSADDPTTVQDGSLRLIMPSDLKMARSVSSLTRI